MPFVFNPFFDEEDENNQLAGQSNIISGSSNTFSNQQSSAPAKSEKASGSFTNLNKYLDANKEQAAGMGNKIADNVESQAVKANDSINALKNNTPSAVNKFNADEWFANPDANKKDQYQTLKNTGGYSGPNSVDKIENYSNYQTDVNKADQAVKNSASETGRFNLLQETYNRPQYSQGMQKLDNSLIQRNDESKARFEDVNNRYKGILDMFNTESENAGKKINDNITQAYQNKQDLVAGEANAKKNLINPIQERAGQQWQANKDLIGRINGDISDYTLSDETLAQLGLNEGQNVFDTNLSNYFNSDSTQVGLDNAATAEERAKYAALAAMIDDPTMNQITTNGKSITPIKFDKSRFDKDIGKKKDEYDKVMNRGRYTGNGSAVTYNNKKISDMSYAELEAALPAMKEQQRLNDENSFDAEGNPIFFQRLPVSAIEELLNSINGTYKPTRKVTRGK